MLAAVSSSRGPRRRPSPVVLVDSQCDDEYHDDDDDSNDDDDGHVVVSKKIKHSIVSCDRRRVGVARITYKTMLQWMSVLGVNITLPEIKYT